MIKGIINYIRTIFTKLRMIKDVLEPLKNQIIIIKIKNQNYFQTRFCPF